MDERRGDDSRDQVLDEVGAAFARLRRRTNLINVDPPVTRKDLSRNQVINIVDEAAGEITVGAVAEQLAVDPSVASRMVTECINEGYLVRKASQLDGRRTVLELSEEGVKLRDRFRSQHRQAFLKITHDWPENKRLTFAQLLIDYADASVALTNRRHDHGAPTPR
ncbi:MarR family winged helix-turn-helix transcriptional regulator [Kineosporia sp. NBRC 101731]|uniref:MarR family winged helix-turn-helix transcriptional regulator n=1 Tax=Kineosporia sp. NBRC 101731 TaxID=3032199 RepID=UPI0024A22ADD|nr:MarR family winged helix-turn-helix transcriptional regulator [Kineosporia sp. NBRC 101731]GLY30783.1 MarR family transcriptional regulator [Kineosporia sp. NBRC 101731]